VGSLGEGDPEAPLHLRPLVGHPGLEPLPLDDGAVPEDRHRVVGPDAPLLRLPAQGSGLEPEPVAPGEHDVLADLHVLRGIVEVALVAGDRPGPVRLLDRDGDLPHDGLALPGEDLRLVGHEPPLEPAALLLLEADLLDAVVGLGRGKVAGFVGQVSPDDEDSYDKEGENADPCENPA